MDPVGRDDRASYDPHWLVAALPLAAPVSFDRKSFASVDTDPRKGVAPRGENAIVIIPDVQSGDIERGKSSHTKNATFTVRRRAFDPTMLFPGDWVMGWVVPNRAKYLDLKARVLRGEPANGPGDGLRFVGRLHSVRKRFARGDDGQPDLSYALQCVGFAELNTQFYYDFAVGVVDVLSHDVGGWQARVGLDANALFSGETVAGNINVIVLAILDLVLGRGASKDVNPAADQGLAAGAGAGLEPNAPNAFVVPSAVGSLLGLVESGGRFHGVLSYADLVGVLQGIQSFEQGNDIKSFFPAHVTNAAPRRWTTDVPLQGTFLPFFPDFVNRPVWDVMNRYVNHAINELYTALRPGPTGAVIPTIVFRQIPFTTDAFDPSFDPPPDDGIDGPAPGHESIPTTRFLDVPRWVLPAALVQRYDIGRSDATRCNYVMTYGQASTEASNMPFHQQIVRNPPIRDDLDIQRSGIHSRVQTVDCAVNDQLSLETTKWNRLIADWAMGSHLTYNGTLECDGLAPPIAEGDNLEFEGVVYHVEGLRDSFGYDAEGKAHWTTTVSVSNGMAAVRDDEFDAGVPGYPGLDATGRAAIDARDPGAGGAG